MPRPKTKEELLSTSEDNYNKLIKMINNLSEKELMTPFDFSTDEKKIENHWNRDKDLKDILIHLYEWHQLLLKWIKSNKNYDSKPFLPEEYNWKNYGEMNVEFFNKHQRTTLAESKRLLAKSHRDVMKIIKTFTNEELFTKKYFDWTGTTSLGSYCVSSTSSHYEWAMKKLRAHKKNCAN